MAIDNVNGGGASDSSSGLSSSNAQSQSQSSGSQGQPSATQAEAIRLTNDALIQLEGQDKPIKFSEYSRGFQSQATKATQERAKLAQKLEQVESTLREREQAYQQLSARQQMDTSRGQQGGGNDIINALRSLPYLDGNSAAQVIEHVVSQIGNVTQSLGQRDQAIALLYQQLKKVTDTVTQIDQQRRSSDFTTRVGKTVKDLGLPEEAMEFAQELYLAYEGDDLDSEFPDILAKRWQQIESIVRNRDKARVEGARRNPFVPGRGGQGQANKPLIRAGMSAKEIADNLWPMVEGGGDT